MCKRNMHFFLLILAFVLFCFVSTALGGEQYEIAETDISITLPDNWFCIDRNVVDDNPACKELGISAKEAKANYLDADCFFMAFNGECYIWLQVDDSKYKDFSELNDEQIKSIYDYSNGSNMNDDYELVLTDVVRYNLPFFKMVRKYKPRNTKIYTYRTVLNAREYYFDVSFISGIRRTSDEIIDNIMQSVMDNRQKNNHIDNESDVIYTDKETGISFRYPKDWEEIPITVEDTFIKLQLTPKQDEYTASISFSVSDLWTLSNLSNYGVKREEADYTLLDNNTIIGMLNPIEVKSIDIQQLGSNYFYVITTNPMEIEESGLHFQFENIYTTTLINGYLLIFQYTTPNREYSYLPTFYSIMGSVHIGN